MHADSSLDLRFALKYIEGDATYVSFDGDPAGRVWAGHLAQLVESFLVDLPDGRYQLIIQPIPTQGDDTP